MLIFLTLQHGALRFGELRREIGEITQRVLTDNLRKLEHEGYLTRTVHAGPPLAVEYELTAKGHSFLKVLLPLVGWAKENTPQG